jgi:hypothetical protein
MIVKLYNTTTYQVVKAVNESHYYREIMRLKFNVTQTIEPTPKRIQNKINYFLSNIQ